MPCEPDHILAEIDRLVSEEVLAIVETSERNETFPSALVSKICSLGLPGLVLGQTKTPDPTTLFCVAIERLAVHWLALAEAVHLQTLATSGLAQHGDDKLKNEFLPDMLNGKLIGSNCLSEPSAGSDLSQIETTATSRGDAYVLNGVKSWVGHAGVSGLLNVYAKTGGAGLGGLTCFLVDAGSPGVQIQSREKKMGVRALPTAKIVFEQVEVPRSRILGRINRGMIVAQSFFVQGRLGIAACAVGLAQAALNRATSYAKARVQFGSKIIEFQGISFLLADMSTEIEAARQLLCRACRERDARGQKTEVLAAQAKLFATDTAMKVTTHAVQVLGAYGYTSDEPVERWMREAKLLQIIEGTNQIQRVTIASRL
ncbi:acyl-CoA dehydrogenase family protein [Bradyrhizobium cytisi]|uniref:3-sulfinopropanoyl-CoA desulfinase n=1 Tax=Bradyrhizobium cytisi TaxID=515489 RepID=A0A5S4WV54_9BRAD|nr:acyl-CoA dehydrogenase family protein [Bradyrhizobium cytisi]TYL85815.1 acyl-CoA dehydrogenase [Bradyrhizobium cytisi]